MAEDRTRQILAHVRQQQSGATVDEIARSVGLHANTVRFHLARLLRDDLVRQIETPVSGRGRPAHTYVARHTMDMLGPRRYRTLATIMLQYIRHQTDPYAAARDAGSSWAMTSLPPVQAPINREQAVARLVEFLDRLDFHPDIDPDGGGDAGGNEIAVRHCPFTDLVPDPLVCEIHRGLMDGALRDTPVDVAAFEPFAAPGQCRARLVSRSAQESERQK